MTRSFHDLHDALRHWTSELARVAVALNLNSLEIVDAGANQPATARGTTHFALPIWHRGRCVAWLRAELRPIVDDEDETAGIHDRLLELRETIEASLCFDDAHAA